MKWTVKIERIDEAGNLHSTTVGHIERPELTSEAGAYKAFRYQIN